MGYGVVDVWQTNVVGSLVTYAFEKLDPAEHRTGSFVIDSETGEIVEQSFVVGDPNERAGLSAQHKIIKAWREGELPVRTQWAG
jgi:hypothetical protein